MIELIVAIFIIVTALVSILSLANRNIQAQNINENTLTASLLAQEGLEIIRNMRDSNWQDGYDWIGSEVDANYQITKYGRYGVDHNFDIYNYNNIDEAILYKKDGFYSHDNTGEATIFRRLIEVDSSESDKLKVDCTVKWTDRGRDQEYVISGELYNWW